MTITSQGNVGVGTTAPASKVTITDPASGEQLRLDPGEIAARTGGAASDLDLQRTGGAVIVHSGLGETSRVVVDASDGSASASPRPQSRSTSRDRAPNCASIPLSASVRRGSRSDRGGQRMAMSWNAAKAAAISGTRARAPSRSTTTTSGSALARNRRSRDFMSRARSRAMPARWAAMLRGHREHQCLRQCRCAGAQDRSQSRNVVQQFRDVLQRQHGDRRHRRHRRRGQQGDPQYEFGGLRRCRRVDQARLRSARAASSDCGTAMYRWRTDDAEALFATSEAPAVLGNWRPDIAGFERSHGRAGAARARRPDRAGRSDRAIRSQRRYRPPVRRDRGRSCALDRRPRLELGVSAGTGATVAVAVGLHAADVGRLVEHGQRAQSDEIADLAPRTGRARRKVRRLT